MENSNKLTKTTKKNALLDGIKTFVYKLSNNSNNEKIVKKIAYLEKYGVLSMLTFKLIVDEMVKDSTNGSIIMSDINDLYVANKFRGKEKVNDMIKNIINTMKGTLEENECKDYIMGKMGDEIYIYMPNKNEQESNVMVDKLKNIKDRELTISIGSCSDLSKGVTSAIKEAGVNMAIYKNKFKSERLKNVCGNNLEKITHQVLKTQLDKMRLNLEHLKNNNKSDLRNTFYKAIAQLNVEKITSNNESKKNFESSNKEDPFEKLKNKYTAEAKSLYGDDSRLVYQHVLANILSKHPVENVISSEFFQGLGYEKAYKNIKKDKNNSTFDLIAIDLSGLKGINDTLGYEEGDNAIYDTLEYVKTTLTNKKVKNYSEIIAKGGGDSYVLVEKMNSNVKDDIVAELQKYGTTNDFKYNMSIIPSVKTIDKSTINKSNFLNVVNGTLTEVENDLEQQSFDRKIKDVEEMKNSIKKVYQQIIDTNDIQILLNDELGQKEDIMEIIKISFENCIQKENNNSDLNNSEDYIKLSKEFKTNITEKQNDENHLQMI